MPGKVCEVCEEFATEGEALICRYCNFEMLEAARAGFYSQPGPKMRLPNGRFATTLKFQSLKP